MSLKVSSPPVITISDRLVCNSSIARCIALNDDAQYLREQLDKVAKGIKLQSQYLQDVANETESNQKRIGESEKRLTDTERAQLDMLKRLEDLERKQTEQGSRSWLDRLLGRD